MRGKVKALSVFAKATLTLVCLIIVTPIIIYSHPGLVGAEDSYTVMSGSMSPALRPGDLVIIENIESNSLNIGDMVTVESEDFTYTHRVVDILEGDRFRLKGDANEDPDPGLVEASQIIGRVTLIFPFGYLYTSYGFAVALLVPATLIIGSQMHAIYQFTRRRNKRETMVWRKKNNRSPIISTSTLLLALILTVSTTRIIAPYFITGSSSYFFDAEQSSGNTFTGDVWKVPSTITCSAYPSTIKSGNSVEVKGSITPARNDVTVTLTYELTGTITRTVQTDINGDYVDTFTLNDIGSWQIIASWGGDVYYFGDTSDTVTVTVGS